MVQSWANRPLSDVTVLDFGKIFQGPYASFLLAKAGAYVIKIEPPRGEPGRRRAEPGKSATLPFAMLNQNKRAITLNLKHERGRALLEEMVGRADVLLENFSPGTMDDLGVGWRRLHELNPRLIYASGTGFGLSGPDRDNLAMDMTIQAASGIMSVTGFPDGPPVKAGPTLVDFMGGIHLYAGIVTALYDRDRSGGGPARRGGDAGSGVADPGGELRLLLPHRRDPAAYWQPAIRPQQRALQRLCDQGWTRRDPRRDRSPFPKPVKGHGARESGRR